MAQCHGKPGGVGSSPPLTADLLCVPERPLPSPIALKTSQPLRALPTATAFRFMNQ